MIWYGIWYRKARDYSALYCRNPQICKAGDNVLDVGTGSGILSICALLSGASHVVGTDLDENAIDAAHENAQVNGITSEQYKV